MDSSNQNSTPEPDEQIQLPGAIPSAQSLIIRAIEVGAAYMIPPHELDGALSEEEIAPRFGEPVIHGNLNYTLFARDYLRAVHGADLGGAEALVPTGMRLRELAAEEDVATMNLNMQLLRDHDSQAHVCSGFPRFEKFVKSETGRSYSRTTLHRRIVHAKFGLLFAAAGAIDILPTQNQSVLIGRLPRRHWVPFWRDVSTRCPSMRISKTALEVELSRYSARRRLPLRGELLEDRSPPRDPEAPDSCEFRDKSSQPSFVTKARTQMTDRRLADLLEPDLHAILSSRVLSNMYRKKSSVGRQYLSAIRATTRGKRQRDKLEQRKNLLRLIEEEHPDLRQEILDFMVTAAFERFDQRLS